jgi:hypothetical protein
MDPITVTLALALGDAIKKKVTGAAADSLFEATKSQARKLEGLLPKDEKKQADLLVAHVLAEAAAYPPEKALTVEPLATTGLVGISAPAGELLLRFLWVNHADFAVQIRDMNVRARIGGSDWQWDLWHRDQFELRGRSHVERSINGRPGLALPVFETGAVICEVVMDALVSGPWEDGRAYQTRQLMKSSLWLPAIGMATPQSTNLISNDADIDLVLAQVLHDQFLKVPVANLVYADIDHAQRLRAGATRERLHQVATKHGHQIELGVELARVTEGRVGFPDGGYSSEDDDY